MEITIVYMNLICLLLISAGALALNDVQNTETVYRITDNVTIECWHSSCDQDITPFFVIQTPNDYNQMVLQNGSSHIRRFKGKHNLQNLSINISGECIGDKYYFNLHLAWNNTQLAAQLNHSVVLCSAQQGNKVRLHSSKISYIYVESTEPSITTSQILTTSQSSTEMVTSTEMATDPETVTTQASDVGKNRTIATETATDSETVTTHIGTPANPNIGTVTNPNAVISPTEDKSIQNSLIKFTVIGVIVGIIIGALPPSILLFVFCKMSSRKRIKREEDQISTCREGGVTNEEEKDSLGKEIPVKRENLLLDDLTCVLENKDTEEQMNYQEVEEGGDRKEVKEGGDRKRVKESGNRKEVKESGDRKEMKEGGDRKEIPSEEGSSARREKIRETEDLTCTLEDGNHTCVLENKAYTETDSIKSETFKAGDTSQQLSSPQE